MNIKLTKKFVEQEIDTKPWGEKLRKFLDVNAHIEKDSYVLEKEEWETFLVDVGIKKSRGVGDTIAKMTKAVGIKPCGGCNKRRKILNNKFKW